MSNFGSGWEGLLRFSLLLSIPEIILDKGGSMYSRGGAMAPGDLDRKPVYICIYVSESL